MLRKRKAVIGLAGLALAGSACLGGVATAPVASAASQACGTSCISLYNQKFGTADVGAVSGGTAVTGQSVILAAAAPTATEDWSVAVQGAVSDFYAAGLMNVTLNAHYGSDLVYEFQYKPGGVSSGECLGIASGPGPGTKVILQPCGKTANTAWIDDAAAASGGYVPYISGSDAQYPAPYVLTAPGAGGGITTQALSVNSGGIVANDQMWQLISGVLGSSFVKFSFITDPVHAGYGVAGTQYDSVNGSWTVPATSCSVHENSEATAWVGLGGLPNVADESLEQIGTDTSCINGTAQYYAWWEMVPPGLESCPGYPSPEPAGSNTPPGCPQLIPFAVRPGDHITAGVNYVGGGLYIMVINDFAQGWSQTVDETGPGDNVPDARNAALWNVEARSGTPLTRYATGRLPVIFFSNCTANNSPILNSSEILELTLSSNRSQWAVPSPLPIGNAFSVTRILPSGL